MEKSMEKTVLIRSEIDIFLRSIDLELRKWISNKPSIVKNIVNKSVVGPSQIDKDLEIFGLCKNQLWII